jgi:plastocyanin
VCLALALVSAPPGWPVAATGAGTGTRQDTLGTIVGTVEIGAPSGRRAVDRYQGRSAARVPRPVQAVPAVVYLEGTPGGERWTGGEAVTLTQSDTLFAPSVVVVPVGGAVVFPNEDSFFHNVFSYSDAKRFDLGRYPQGESKQVVFDRPGVVQVFCEVHEHMRAVILVIESPFHAITADDGTFSIPDVPAGSHRLAVWHPDGQRIVPVEVAESGTTAVEVSVGQR